MAPACGSSEANSSSRRRSVRCCWGCWEVCQLSLRQGAKRVVGSWLWPLLLRNHSFVENSFQRPLHTWTYSILWYSMIIILWYSMKFYMKIPEGLPLIAIRSRPGGESVFAAGLQADRSVGFILYHYQSIPKYPKAMNLPKGHTLKNGGLEHGLNIFFPSYWFHNTPITDELICFRGVESPQPALVGSRIWIPRPGMIFWHKIWPTFTSGSEPSEKIDSWWW